MLPSWEFVQDNVLPIVFYLALPALTASAVTMAAGHWLGDGKQSSAAGALALCAGAVSGLWCYTAVPILQMQWPNALDLAAILSALDDALSLGQSTWSRLPWAILAALLIGRLACLADAHAGDGWLLRGGTAIPIAWSLVPENSATTLSGSPPRWPPPSPPSGSCWIRRHPGQAAPSPPSPSRFRC